MSRSPWQRLADLPLGVKMLCSVVAFAIVRLPGEGGHVPAEGLKTGVTQPIELPGVQQKGGAVRIVEPPAHQRQGRVPGGSPPAHEAAAVTARETTP